MNSTTINSAGSNIWKSDFNFFEYLCIAIQEYLAGKSEDFLKKIQYEIIQILFWTVNISHLYQSGTKPKLVAKIFATNFFLYQMISQYLFGKLFHSRGSSICNLWKSRTHLSGIVDIMTADDLVVQGARASAAMVLTYLFWDI